jgi:hypothetical protein
VFVCLLFLFFYVYVLVFYHIPFLWGACISYSLHIYVRLTILSYFRVLPILTWSIRYCQIAGLNFSISFHYFIIQLVNFIKSPVLLP